MLERETGDLPAVEMESSSEKVIVRSTPDALSVLKETKEVQIDRKERSFQLDGAFAEDASQKEVFQRVGLPVLVEVMKGFNGCIFAYGQTGSGKTHSLLNTEVTNMEDVGILPRLVATLFARAAMDKANVYQIQAAGFQVYNEQVDDLLHSDHRRGGGQNLSINKGGDIPELTWTECKSPASMLEIFKRARSQIHYAETKMNKSSSRSHAVFQIRIVRRRRAQQGAGASAEGAKGATRMQATCGQLSVVDLAGSERVKRSGVTGSNFKEATNINGSLLALGNVIQALADKRKHVPFRDSKLTRILEGSVGGNCKTALLVCISPSENSTSETLSTLEFASRAMCVEVNATVNETFVEIDAARLAADMDDESGANYVDDEMLKTFKESEQALADARAKVEEQERRAANMEKEMNKMSDELQARDRSIVEAEKLKKRQLSQIDALKEELAKTVKQNSVALEKSERAQQSLQAKVLQAEREVETTKQALQRLTQRHADEQKAKQEVQARLAALEADLRSSEAEATRALQESRSECANLEGQLARETAARKAETQALQTAIAEERTKAAALQANLDQISSEKQSLQANLRSINVRMESVSNMLSNEQEKVVALSTVQAEAQVLRGELEAFKAKEADLLHRLEEAQSERNALDGQVAQLEGDQATLKSGLAHETTLRTGLEAEKAQLSQELASTAQRLQENQRLLQETQERYLGEVATLRTEHEENVTKIRRQSAADAEKQARHAAEAMQALELRARQEHDKMHEKLENVQTDLTDQADAHADEIARLHAQFAEEMASALQREREVHAKEVAQLREQIEQSVQELVAAEKAQASERRESVQQAQIELLRARVAHHAARRAVEKHMDRLRQKYAQLHARFQARESRTEDLQRIADQQRELSEMKRAVKNAKRITQQKQLELEHVIDNVRIFGTPHDGKNSHQKKLPGQKLGDHSTFMNRQRTMTPSRAKAEGMPSYQQRQQYHGGAARPRTGSLPATRSESPQFLQQQETAMHHIHSPSSSAQRAARRPLPTPPGLS
ncbi:Kinesin-like protein [Hondaea fermentalgiana]|uniref:Kinesin-like protein n=1 Tax=Hondaea fermentalgiana TaxID=2315210 RepID=A0A2R5GJL2_9STRA|nr:Kinesin-like protein [Hondaea fermentalgiana]|eukprot:GBG28471.1 Kinesin-like protein [Hondaea fermentalgiana]